MNMTFRLSFLIFVLSALGLHLPVQAVQELYAAEAPILDESAAERSKSISQAFHQVLVKVTGNRAVAGRAGVPELVSQASRYVQQYRFRVEPSEEEGGLPGRFIWVRFDRVSVDRALSEIGLQSWNAARPKVLLWLAHEQGGQRNLLNLEHFEGVEKGIRQAAELRALPLKLPLMDLQDQADLSAADVWAGYEAAIAAASERYTHDVVLAGKLTSRGEQWNASWTLYDSGTVFPFHSTGQDLLSVLSEGISQAADAITQRYAPAVAGDGLDQLYIRVVEVNDLADYAQVLDIVRGQDAVAKLAVNRAMADELLLDVWVRGAPEVMERGLELGGQLVRQADIPDTSTGETLPGSTLSVTDAERQRPQLTYRLR